MIPLLGHSKERDFTVNLIISDNQSSGILMTPSIKSKNLTFSQKSKKGYFIYELTGEENDFVKITKNKSSSSPQFFIEISSMEFFNVEVTLNSKKYHVKKINFKNGVYGVALGLVDNSD